MAADVLKVLNCSSSAELQPWRMGGFEYNGKHYIYKEGGSLANHRAEYVGANDIMSWVDTSLSKIWLTRAGPLCLVCSFLTALSEVHG